MRAALTSLIFLLALPFAVAAQWTGLAAHAAMQKGIVSVTLLTTAVLLGGCSLVGPEACTDDLRWRVSPEEVELALGQSTTVQGEAFGCGGKEPLEEDMRWTSADPEVATVDLTTGRVTAIGTGATAITGEDEGPYGIGPVEIPVTVAP